MLFAKEKSVKDMKIICRKCREVMKLIHLDRYEYLEGIPLYEVPAYKCSKCGNEFFTEKMVDEMEVRSEEIRRHQFAFRRRLAVSGGGLVVRVPSDLANDLKLKEGQEVKILPVNHKGFLVET